MDKNPRDQINKAAWLLIESAKDAASRNIMQAVMTAQVKLEAEPLQKLLTIVAASIEEGYSRANKAFCRSVDQALASATKTA